MSSKSRSDSSKVNKTLNQSPNNNDHVSPRKSPKQKIYGRLI
jgi:hypothetical protein